MVAEKHKIFFSFLHHTFGGKLRRAEKNAWFSHSILLTTSCHAQGARLLCRAVCCGKPHSLW